MSNDFGMFADPEPKVYEPDPEPEVIQDPFKIMEDDLNRFAASFSFMTRPGKSSLSSILRQIKGRPFRGEAVDTVVFDDFEAKIDLGKYFLTDSIGGIRAVPALDFNVKQSSESKAAHKAKSGDAKKKGPKQHKRWAENGNGNSRR